MTTESEKEFAEKYGVRQKDPDEERAKKQLPPREYVKYYSDGTEVAFFGVIKGPRGLEFLLTHGVDPANMREAESTKPKFPQSKTVDLIDAVGNKVQVQTTGLIYHARLTEGEYRLGIMRLIDLYKAGIMPGGGELALKLEFGEPLPV